MPYREDTGKKDQGRAFLHRGSASPAPNEDDPSIMTVATPVADEDGRTYKTLSKQDIPITTSTTLTTCRSRDTSAIWGTTSRLVDDPVSVRGRFNRCADEDPRLPAEDVTKRGKVLG
jgi:hypothetical protein